MRIWKENFSLEKEYFTVAPVWIILYSLLQEYWRMKILEGIGNTLRSFVRIAETTLLLSHKIVRVLWVCGFYLSL
jgi:hypothetical protein